MELTVKGMRCGHCEVAVRRAIENVAPQADVAIDRSRQLVSISGGVEVERVLGAIRDQGYEVSDRT